MGIFLEQASDAQILYNTISTTTKQLSGIFMNSSSGYIRNNSITGHSVGITFSNSSPMLGMNNIYFNYINGLLINPGSQPDLMKRIAQVPNCNPPMYYPVSGYNSISNNGGYNSSPFGYINDDGSEIFFNNSYILMNPGCNDIVDDRIPGQGQGMGVPPYTTINLMNGSLADQQRSLKARYNSWGNHPLYDLEERFGSLDIVFEPQAGSSCVLPQDPIGCPLYVYDLDGNVIDTIYASDELNGDEEEIDGMYAMAESFYNEGEYDDALLVYNQIITSYPDYYRSVEAYSRLYRVEKVRNAAPETFSSLKSFYDNQLTIVEDSILIKILNQLSRLCLVGEELYIPAIDAFVDVIENTTNTDEALSAEIDAVTTALLASYNGNQLGKYSTGNLAAKNSKDYSSKIKQLMWNKYGMEGSGTEEAIIPTEYLLYQNYPNPFNPTTKINYDLPEAGNISLIVYDILGRQVKVLADDNQQAGRYEVSFNASNLASGVYIYQLRAGKFVATKKMILLR
jgi:tetratricopeptide (TPR) repeat protein